MYNIIVFGDMHSHNYKNYNNLECYTSEVNEKYSKYSFRLRQTIELAYYLVEEISKYNVKEVWIAGDLLFICKPSPIVLSALKDFINILVEKTDVVIRLIPGNHDTNNQVTKVNHKYNTLLHLLELEKRVFCYSDDLVEINNRTVHFHTWSPNKYIDYKNADILVGHGDPSPFEKDGEWKYYNYGAMKVKEGLKNDSYKIVLSGHIHQKFKHGKHWSVSNIYPHSFGDQDGGAYTLLDLDKDICIENLQWIDTPKERFMTFKTYYDKSEYLANKKDDKNNRLATRFKKYVKKRSVINENNNMLEEVKQHKKDLELDPQQKILDIINSSKMDDEIKKDLISIIGRSYDVDYKIPNIRYTIDRVKIKDFLSILNLDMDFSDIGRNTYIVGKIGNGKTNLLKFIKFMLFGDLKNVLMKDIQSSKKYMKLPDDYNPKFHGELYLTYDNNKYKIERTLSSTKFYKMNDNNEYEIFESNSKRDIQSTIQSELSFMKYWSILNINQASKGIFASMSDSSKVSFMSNFIGVPIIEKWSKELDSLIGKYKDDIKSLERVIDNANVKIETFKTLTDETLEYKDISKLESEKNTLEMTINIIKNKKEDLNNRLLELNKFNKDLFEKYNKITIELEYNDEEERDLIIQRDGLKVDLDKIYKTISDLDIVVSNLNKKLDEEERNIKDLNSTIEKLKENKCPSCNREYTDLEERNKNIESIQKTVDSVKNNMDKLILQRNSLLDKIREVELDKKDLNERLEYKEKLLDIINNKKIEYENFYKMREELLNILNKYIDIYKDDIDSDRIETIKKGEIDIEVNYINSKISEIENNINLLDEKVKSIISEIVQTKYNNEKYEKQVEIKKDIELFLKRRTESLDEIKKLDDKISKLDKFNSKYLSKSGILVALLLETVAESMNIDDMLKVECIKKNTTGKIQPVLNIKLWKEEFNSYIDYDKLSGGELVLSDLYFLRNLINLLNDDNSSTVLFFDEIFKFFGSNEIFIASEILNEINVKSIITVIHSEIVSSISDTTIVVDLDENGSKYSII